jgi:hypothetical protein
MTNHIERPDAAAAVAMVIGVTVRPALESDRPALERLAALDSSAVPAGDILVAAIDGELRAAVAVHSRMAIADPFHPTAELVSLLRARAQQLEVAEKLSSRSRARGLARRLRIAE